MCESRAWRLGIDWEERATKRGSFSRGRVCLHRGDMRTRMTAQGLGGFDFPPLLCLHYSLHTLRKLVKPSTCTWQETD